MCAGVAASILIVELALASGRVHLSQAMWNYVESCYERDAATPIWSLDPVLDLPWPRPHVRTRCGWNGYHWRHESDRLGFRNPEDWDRVEVAVLGDSMVYGHGVEEDVTLTAVLRRALGVRVANLGRLGASPVDYLVQARNVVPLLSPRVVVLFLYRNDLADINRARTRAQITRFVETGRAIESAEYPASSFVGRRPVRDTTSALVHAASRLRSFRVARFVWLERVAHARMDVRPAFRAPEDDALGMAYTARMLASARDVLARRGARLVLAYMPSSVIPGSRADRKAQAMREGSRRLAASLGLSYFDPTDVTRMPDGSVDHAAFLPRDFHLSATGHARIAHALAAFLRREGLVASAAERDDAAR